MAFEMIKQVWIFFSPRKAKLASIKTVWQRPAQFSSEISQVLISMTPKYLAAKWKVQSITQLFCLCVSPSLCDCSETGFRLFG